MFTQWDIVRVRINPDDRDEHPAVVLSREEACLDPRHRMINVLYGTTRRPADGIPALAVQLNGSDGLERPSLFDCAQIYLVQKIKVSSVLGRVSPVRRRQIGRKIVESYRLPL